MTTPDPMKQGDDWDLWYDPELQCSATSKQTGKRCRRPRTPGHRVCWYHGSPSPQSRKAAARRLAEAKLVKEQSALLAELGEDYAELPPHEILVASVHQAWLRAALFEFYASEQAEPWGADHLGDHRPTAAEEGLRYWSTEASRRAKLAVDAGVDAKRVELEERTVGALVERMRAFAGAMLELVAAQLGAAGVELGLVQRAFAEANPEAYRRALGQPAVDVESSESG